MPTYQYVCRSCATPLEVVQTFTEPALTDCPNCDGGQLRKVFNSVGVVFKGSGFYRTDSRSDSSSAGLKPSGTADSGAGTGDGKAAKKDSDSGSSGAATTSASTTAPASTSTSASGTKTQSAAK